jgi:hypothetical protein
MHGHPASFIKWRACTAPICAEMVANRAVLGTETERLRLL